MFIVSQFNMTLVLLNKETSCAVTYILAVNLKPIMESRSISKWRGHLIVSSISLLSCLLVSWDWQINQGKNRLQNIITTHVIYDHIYLVSVQKSLLFRIQEFPINDDQCWSMPFNVNHYRSNCIYDPIEKHWEEMIGVDLHQEKLRINNWISIGIDWHSALIKGVLH